MAILAAANIVGILMAYPVWNSLGIKPFLRAALLKAVSDILNATELSLHLY